MKRQISLALGALVFLCGCSLAPEYTRPQSPIPAEWPQGAAYKDMRAMPRAATVLVEELKREDFFADKQLQKIIEMALDNNLDLRLAALNVERARALYGIQRAELFPAVNAVGAGGKQRSSADLVTSGDPRTREQYGVELGIAAWEIDFFGRIRSLKDRALEEYLATEQARRSSQILLVSEVARVYLTLAADRENFKLAHSTLETQQAAYGLVQKRYDVGIATELDLRRAQIPVDAARGDVARYTQMVAQDQNALNLLIGFPMLKKFLPADLGTVNPLKDIFPGLSSEVLLKRPDILQAEPGHNIRYCDNDFTQMPSSVNNTEKSASQAITRKIALTTLMVV